MILTVNSQESLSKLIGELRVLYTNTRYFQVSVTTGKSRTLSQNAIAHAWYGQVATEEREYTPGHIKRLCKYHFGLPILRAEVDLHGKSTEQAQKIGTFCDNILYGLAYEERIEAMEFFPVTSLMRVKQLSEYLEHIQHHYASRVDLRFPE